ncbi:MAG: hypothetical protein HKN56_02845 [Gammaproteobacteria bacterium]|nr:hypothetical protein [Gammaproteobacteria bacterium]
MKASIFIVVVLALGALAAHYLMADNGYVLINFRGYTVEMSVPVMAFLLLLTYMVVRLLVRVWRAPRKLGEAVAQRRLRKAGERITLGYIELGQGNFAKGERLLTKGARNSETPLLNYLAAARAAHAQGDTERRDAWLDMAAEQEPRAEATVLLTRAQLQMDDDDVDGAAETLSEVLEASPKNTEALRLKAEIAVAREEWRVLEELLPRLRKSRKVPATLLDEWTVSAWVPLLEDAAGDSARSRSLWKAVPKALQDRPALIRARVRSLLAAGESRQAESLLRSALKKQWAEELVLAYGDLETPPAADRLKRVEKWLQQHPEDPSVLLVAARLCVATELWGKARSYYESSVAIRPSPQAWHELGQLLQQMGEQEGAFNAFQQGLTQSYPGAELPRLPNAKLSD